MKIHCVLLVSVAFIFGTSQAGYRRPRYSPYQQSPYSYFSARPDYYRYQEPLPNTMLQKRQLAAWSGPYSRQNYWQNPSLERPIDRTFQTGVAAGFNPFGSTDEGVPTGEATEQEEGGILEAAMPALVGGVFAVALSSIFTNSLMVNATTNETFPQLFAIPQLIDPYNPPRIVRRDAEGNAIEDSEFADDRELLLHLISDNPCARAKLSCLIGQRIVYFTREQGLLEDFLNPDVLEVATEPPGQEDHPLLAEVNLEPPGNEIVPIQYKNELKDFLLSIKESDCVHIRCQQDEDFNNEQKYDDDPLENRVDE